VIWRVEQNDNNIIIIIKVDYIILIGTHSSKCSITKFHPSGVAEQVPGLFVAKEMFKISCDTLLLL